MPQMFLSVQTKMGPPKAPILLTNHQNLYYQNSLRIAH